MKKLIFLFILSSFIFAKQFLYQNQNLFVKSFYCDQIIKDYNQTKCYSYKFKEPLFNIYLADKKSDEINIESRPSFKEDPRIPEPYQNKLECYYKSGYDRGHLAFDSLFDYNWTILKTTYLTSNIVPQTPLINRYRITKIEYIERDLAKNNIILSITGVFSFTKEHLKDNIKCPRIPKKYFKIIFIKENNFWKLYKVFLIDNEIKEISLNNFNRVSKFIKVFLITNKSLLKIYAP